MYYRRGICGGKHRKYILCFFHCTPLQAVIAIFIKLRILFYVLFNFGNRR